MDITRRRFTRNLLLGGTASGLLGAVRRLRAHPAQADSVPQRKYRACIIGHTGRGNYGHGLDLCFQKIPAVTVVAVADPDEKARADTAQKTAAPRSYSDWREMLQKEKPNLLSIGPRWVEGRLEMVRAAADAGAHVYMEKPLARSLDEADSMLEVASKAKIEIALAFHALL